MFIPEACMKINENMKASDLSASGGLVQNPGDSLMDIVYSGDKSRNKFSSEDKDGNRVERIILIQVES